MNAPHESRSTSEPKPMRLVRWVLFGWVYWLQSQPGGRGGVRALGVLNIVAAAPLLLFLAASIPERIESIDNAAKTASVDAACNRFTKGGTYVIDVAGHRYECTGSESWCPRPVPTDIVYNSQRPAQCRPATAVGELSRWERAALLHYAAQSAFGISFLFIREHDHSKARAILAHGLLLFWAVAVAYMVVFKFSALQ